MEIEGYIFKKGRGKNASFFVKRNFTDNNKNIVLDAFSTENNIASTLQQEIFHHQLLLRIVRLLLTVLIIIFQVTPQILAKLRHLQRTEVVIFCNK